jgi:hypothetical protein
MSPQSTANGVCKWRKAIVLTCGILAFLALNGLWYLDFYYYAYSPRAPVPTEGRIYSDSVHHGTRVYLTECEYLSFRLLLPLCIAFGLLAAYLHSRWQPFAPYKKK